MKFDYSGMRTVKDFQTMGYKFLALSENGACKVHSYIAKVRGKKLYGHYDYQTAKYIEETCCH